MRVFRNVLGLLVGLTSVFFSATVLTGSAEAFDYYDVYFVAHPDDWQIFQAPNTFSDVKLGDRVLIIQASASDAGRTDGYWQAREEGTKASVRWMVGDASESDAWVTACSQLRCHTIFTWNYGPVTIAFLRVPDGGGLGTDSCGGFGKGTPAYGCNSLSQLRDAAKKLPTVDGSSSYLSWVDLHGTVFGITQIFGFPLTPFTWVNAPEFDRTLNPNDHPDHLAIGDAARELQFRQVGWHFAYFVGDDLIHRPINLNQSQHDVKMGVYYAYYSKLVDIIGSTINEVCSFESGFASVLWRTYFRTF